MKGDLIQFEDLGGDTQRTLLAKMDRLAKKYGAPVTVGEITRSRWLRTKLTVYTTPKRFIRIFAWGSRWQNADTMQIEGGPSGSTKYRRMHLAWEKYMKIEGAKIPVMERIDWLETPEIQAVRWKFATDYEEAQKYLESVKEIVLENREKIRRKESGKLDEAAERMISLHDRFMKDMHGDNINIDL